MSTPATSSSFNHKTFIYNNWPIILIIILIIILLLILIYNKIRYGSFIIEEQATIASTKLPPQEAPISNNDFVSDDDSDENERIENEEKNKATAAVKECDIIDERFNADGFQLINSLDDDAMSIRVLPGK